MRRLLLAVFTLALCGLGPLAGDALACPMCKAANETQPALPRAYMYSILFMLAVPATVATSFGVGLYRLSKQLPTPTDEDLAAWEASAAGAGDDGCDDRGDAQA